MKIKYLSLLLWGAIVSCGCSVQPESNVQQKILPPSKLRIDQICQSYIRGDYKNLIHLIYNYKDKSDRYQQQLSYMLIHHELTRTHDSLSISSIQPNKIVMRDSDRIAEVFCDVSYKNGNSEEIFFPMIYADGKWWIK